MFLQTLFTGLSVGGIYALMAVGYSLIFSILNFSNFAHGSVIMLGAYMGLGLASKFGLKLGFVVAGAMAGGGLLAVLNERLAYRKLRHRNAPSLYLMISAMGCSVFLENMVYVTIGSRFYAFPEFFTRRVVTFLGSSVSVMDLFALGFSLLAIGALGLFLARSRTGIAVRAGVCDMTMCSLMGVDTDRLVALVFLLAGALGGLAGTFMGVRYLVYPTMGWITNKAYIAAVIGGLGSLLGAIVGGVILGVVETFISAYVSSVLRDVFSFTILVALLVCMPNGLFGKSMEERV